MGIERFEDIEAWQLARELTRKVYGLAKKVKLAHDFGLKGQIQNAAGSSMHNIAEGRQRQYSKEFLQHLSIACGSLAEVETHIQIAGRLNHIGEDQTDKVLNKGYVRVKCGKK